MSCAVCGGETAIEIFNHGPVYIWTDTSDDESVRTRFRCELHQCTRCGHVYQPVDVELRAAFDQIYRSSNAQGPSPMGAGSWGLDRAERLFFSAVRLSNHRSAIEIGCGDGYLLSRLKERGFQRLIGIEPSVNLRKDLDGITILNRFVDRRLQLGETVDLIFSIAVFEHLEDLGGALSFCRDHLAPDGELFFVVPNAERQLAAGDPALFVHQHVHYFTEQSIRQLLERNGFRATAIVATSEAFQVTARRRQGSEAAAGAVTLYRDYQRKVEDVITGVRQLVGASGAIVHGACNALNNFADRLDADYTLADNDENKQGKRYFGKIVRAPADVDLPQHRAVIVLPYAYFEQIRADYRRRGFDGDVISALARP